MIETHKIMDVPIFPLRFNQNKPPASLKTPRPPRCAQHPPPLPARRPWSVLILLFFQNQNNPTNIPLRVLRAFAVQINERH